VAAVPGDASCFTKLVCRLAGKPFVVDEFKAGELVETGKLTPAQLSEVLGARQIRYYPQAIWAMPNTSLTAWLKPIK
jgi:hypothetical protein